jgi:exopolysaccharide biosynthesis polyprenyl glycosylphosphotransferase
MFWFVLSFVLAAYLRLGVADPGLNLKLVSFVPGILCGAAVFPCAAYVSGLYSRRRVREFWRASLVMLNPYVWSGLAMVSLFYFGGVEPIGRGVFVLGLLLAYFTGLVRRRRAERSVGRARVVALVASSLDERQARDLLGAWAQHFELVGIIPAAGYQPKEGLRCLKAGDGLGEALEQERVDRILFQWSLADSREFLKSVRAARYRGIAVSSYCGLCEEIYQFIPIEMISSSWLDQASSFPHRIYITKFKRAFDVIASASLLLLLWPVLLAAGIAVRLSSPGPVLYWQTRVGRFGRTFRMVKLRTMRTDAESSGPVWASSGDSRQTAVGKLLRKYRIDELPQLLNIFRGEMSFVGPRPERPEFVEELAKEIPHYEERLMIHPGLTGWAQVSFPYGASVSDARRKLEYDLYYLKHMSVVLDLLILLDTVRTVLRGGASSESEPLRFSIPDEIPPAPARAGRPANLSDLAHAS